MLTSELAAKNLKVKIIAGNLMDDSVISAAVAAGEKIDVLINNAGIMDDFVPPVDVDDELWNRVLGVNVTSVMKLSRAVIKKMLTTGGE